jgi:type IV pilus assembly protein PilM
MMLWTPLKMVSKKFLGIDIGTALIKIVELSRRGERRKLENYGEIAASSLYQRPFRTFEKSTLLLSSQNISRAILAVMEEAKIKTKQAIFSLPDFSSFFTSFELPPMSEEELSQAVRYEARQHVPLPLPEVTLDWTIVEGEVSDTQRTKLKILLVAVPNEVVNQYREISRLSGLQLVALEAEVFGLVKSLVGQEKKTILLVDIGAQSTTCSVIENQTLKTSHSFDISGNELTRLIAKGLSVDYGKGENLKRKYGLSPFKIGIRQILLPLVDLILAEIEKISQNFYRTEGEEIEKVVLAGGTALLPGLKEYIQNALKKEVEIANPFSNIFYPPILENNLKEMGPAYAIAVGMALSGLE